MELILMVIAVASPTIFAVCQATCSPCSFQWSEHKHHCYRYFPGPLPYDEAEAYCRRNVTGRAGALAAIGSLEEMMFMMQHVGKVANGTTPFYTPGYVWLDKTDRAYESYNMIYFNALSSNHDPDGYFKSCETHSSSVAVSMSDQGTGASSMVPAPEVVEHNCAVYAGEGAFIDLGEFAGKCVSDPDVCVSESVSWSLWLKINSSADRSGHRYFVSTGGQTRRARGVFFSYKESIDMFLLGARSLRKSWTFYRQFAASKIPIDIWFHLAATVDLTQTSPELLMYVDGNLLDDNGSGTEDISQDDTCTRLFLGNANLCAGSPPPPSETYGASASYSNLMVFDGLLTQEQIGKLHACGSLDWGLKVRSLYLDDTYTYSGNLRYVCTASISTGPTIYWSVYHADQAQWEDLGLSTGEGVEITPTSFSPCVVQSVLVINQTRGPVSAGDIISCMASSGSLNASVYIRQGEGMTFSYSDHDNTGLFVSSSGQPHYKSVIATSSEDDGDRGSYPFICEKADRR